MRSHSDGADEFVCVALTPDVRIRSQRSDGGPPCIARPELLSPSSRSWLPGRSNLAVVLRTIKLALPGVIVVALGCLAAMGRLPRNTLAGIRIPSTMRSDEAWSAGHRGAASALIVSGLGPIVVAMIVGIERTDNDTQSSLTRVGGAWLVGWLGVATFRASRAARATYVG